MRTINGKRAYSKIMKSGFIGVPFKAENGNGLSESHGIAKFSEAGIVLEFESKFLGLIGGEVKEVRIGLDEILDIKFKKGIYKFFSRIQIRLGNLEKLSRLPNESGRIKLKIKREDFELARKAFEQTMLYLSGDEPGELPGVRDTNDQLPPAQTSVNELFDTEKFKTNDLNKTTKLKND